MAYTRKLKIPMENVDSGNRLRLSQLLQLAQEAATEHAEVLNAGRALTIERGCFWVVAGRSSSHAIIGSRKTERRSSAAFRPGR